MDLDTLLGCYFRLGLSYGEIRNHLFSRNNVNISEITVKRRLNRMGLYRKKFYSSASDVVDFVLSEIEASGRQVGYKWLHLKAIQKGLVVTQNIIRECLKLLDEEGVERRKSRRLRRRAYISRGPNFTHHVDGYDKLKPFGLCISGSIDGFSRYITWLKVSYTNNDPKVIAGM